MLVIASLALTPQPARALAVEVALLSLVFGGASLAIGSGGGMYWPVPRTLLGSWAPPATPGVLLVEIIRQRRKERETQRSPWKHPAGAASPARRNRGETISVDDGAMASRRIRIGCEFTYVAEIDTPVIFQVQPGESPTVVLQGEQWSSKPPMAIRGYTDLYGNPCARAVLPSGRSSLEWGAVANVPDATEDADESAPERAPDALPDNTLIYILPSRYCLPDVLADEAWSRFGGLLPGYGRVQSICDYVHSHLTFQYGSTTSLSTAADVNEARRGVCRDFTHLAISFCRALNIPARYVFGYLPDMDVPPDPAPMDFAAWMEVWLGDQWWTFDPRNNMRRKGRIVIGRGRDASDVAMATTFGGPFLENMVVHAEEEVTG